MTSTTIERQPEPNRPHGFGHVHHIVDSIFFGNSPTFAIDHVIATKAGGKFLFQSGIRKHIAGQLPKSKLIEREVCVEGSNNPIAPRPHGSFVVPLVTVGVGVASCVEPIPCHAFSECTRLQKASNHFFVCSRSRICNKVIHFVYGRRKSRQVESHPPDQGPTICFESWLPSATQ